MAVQMLYQSDLGGSALPHIFNTFDLTEYMARPAGLAPGVAGKPGSSRRAAAVAAAPAAPSAPSDTGGFAPLDLRSAVSSALGAARGAGEMAGLGGAAAGGAAPASQLPPVPFAPSSAAAPPLPPSAPSAPSPASAAGAAAAAPLGAEARADLARQRRRVEEAFQYAQVLVRGTVDHRDEIDAMIRGQADNWRLERMPAVDRNILRLAIYEMLYESETPKLVVVDEAIELAKKFGSEQSGRFVNGLLDGLLKQRSFPGTLT